MTKLKGLFVCAVIVAGLAVAPGAFAHTKAFTLVKDCNTETGNYDLKWTVSASDQNLNPKISASNRASIAVGSSVGASTVFTESIPGDSTSVSATITVKWSDNFTQNGTAGAELDGKCKPPVEPNCPEGLTKIDYDQETKVLRCKETVTVTRDVPGPTVTVTGPPVPGPTVYVDKPGPAGPTVYIKVKGPKGPVRYVKVKPKIKRVIVRVCPIKPYEPKLTG